jgi:mRNA interferase MazF
MNIGTVLSQGAMYKQGDIVLVPFPFTNQAGTKHRPALVISGSNLNKTADIILVQITSKNRTDGFSIPINNTVDLTTPLKYLSETRCNKLLVADQSLIITKISTVKSNIVSRVVAIITTLFMP